MADTSDLQGMPLFIGTTAQLGLLSKWLDDLDCAVYCRVIDNEGFQGFDEIDGKALSKVLPFGCDVLGCVNPADAQKCLSFIGDLQRDLAVSFGGGLWEATKSSAERQQAYDRLFRTLTEAMPCFHWLRVRVRNKLLVDPPHGPPGQDEGNGGAGLTPRSRTPNTAKPKRGRPVDEATIRRAEFAKPLYEKRQTWPEIHAAYSKKYPKDIDASPDTLRLAFQRQYPEAK